MRLLHTSDWHLGKTLYDFSLLDDQRHMIDFLLEVIGRERIDAVIIAGDIYDRPVPSAEAVRLYDYFLTRAVAEMGVPVVAVAGNHDSASRLECGGSLYAAAGYHVFGSIKAGQRPVILHDDFGEVRIYPVAWAHPVKIRALFGDESIKTFNDAYREILDRQVKALDLGIRNIAVAHGFFAGLSSHGEKDMIVSDSEISVGGMEIADSNCFSEFSYAALGHLHAPQRAGGETARYSGSPLKYSLSEENQRKSFIIVELLEKNNLCVKTIPIPALHDVRTVTGSFDELLEPSRHENKNFDDYVFANITDLGALYPMEKLRTLFPNLLGLRFTALDCSPTGFEPRVLMGEERSAIEMFRRFYKASKGFEMENESLEFLREVIEKGEVESE